MRAALLALFLPLAALAAEPVTLHYIPRPPYLEPQRDGRVTGLTADVAAAAFRQVEIPVVWVHTPFLRQMAILKETATRDCSVGTYRTPERERHARYTRPIYQDRRVIALSSVATAKLAGTDRLARMFANRELTLLVKDGYSYGADIDARIRRHKPRIYGVAQESDYMLRMLLAGHGNYLLVAEEEARALIAHEGLPVTKFALTALRDAPPGELRHIACSRRVSAAEIAALNAAIATVPGVP